MNQELKSYARRNGVRLWQIAEKLNISEATMTRLLRRELPEEVKCTIIDTIERLLNEREQEKTIEQEAPATQKTEKTQGRP